MSEHERYIVQEPEHNGLAGPWAIWDTLSSTFNGRHYTDDPVISCIEIESHARRVCQLLNDRDRLFVLSISSDNRITTLESAVREVIREMVADEGEPPATDDDWSTVHGWIAALRAGLGEGVK